MSEQLRTMTALVKYYTGEEIEVRGDNFLCINRLIMVYPAQFDGYLPTEELLEMLGCRWCQIYKERVDLKDHPMTLPEFDPGKVGEEPASRMIHCELEVREKTNKALVPCRYDYKGTRPVEISRHLRFREPDNHLG